MIIVGYLLLKLSLISHYLYLEKIYNQERDTAFEIFGTIAMSHLELSRESACLPQGSEYSRGQFKKYVLVNIGDRYSNRKTSVKSFLREV